LDYPVDTRTTAADTDTNDNTTDIYYSATVMCRFRSWQVDTAERADGNDSAQLRSRDAERCAGRSKMATKDGVRDAERRVLRRSHVERNSHGTVRH